MVVKRPRPFIYITWLKKYLTDDHLCRWSIWYRIFHKNEETSSSYNVQNKIKHANLRNKIQRQYSGQGFEVYPEQDITISGKIATLKGKIDLIAINKESSLIIETKTGKPHDSDLVQLMLYIWALPKTETKFRGRSYDGLLIYESHQVEISSIDVDETFVNSLSDLITDVLKGEPDRKFPSPRECRFCGVAECDERAELVENKVQTNYIPDFF